MVAQWTADVIGKLHTNRLKQKDLADYLGYHPKYLSAILNGHKCPKNAEAKINAALDEMITERSDSEITVYQRNP